MIDTILSVMTDNLEAKFDKTKPSAPNYERLQGYHSMIRAGRDEIISIVERLHRGTIDREAAEHRWHIPAVEECEKYWSGAGPRPAVRMTHVKAAEHRRYSDPRMIELDRLRALLAVVRDLADDTERTIHALQAIESDDEVAKYLDWQMRLSMAVDRIGDRICGDR